MIGLTALTVVVRSGSDAAPWAAAIGTFLAAAVALWIAVMTNRRDTRREARRDRLAEIDREMTDLDETRRLLFTAWFRPAALADPMLFSTITHALAKHSELMGEEEAAQMLTRRADGSGEQTIRELVDRIDIRLASMQKRRDFVRGRVPGVLPDVFPWYRRVLRLGPRTD